ncbi:MULTISPECIES: hypothetical protein [unclassified Leifsonia]|uniref:hypothetical protein n=1 Tax=unclassified Leifsonia TaxID=2663824 RepID=UPI000701B510|nr:MULTISPECIES: hypothetical protein [unclassified Leifsonia]KQX06940.1 hypothetical protein ASC59_03745 [Leifsonia sp. Root1293]KRA11224.1 hypothetical protein ASD61_03745 [Leifsonia sp. Root60]
MSDTQQATPGTGAPIAATTSVGSRSLDETTVLPSLGSEAEAGSAPTEVVAVPAASVGESTKPAKKTFSWFQDQPMRLTLVVIIGVVALFFAFGLLIIFSPSSAAVSALAVIATPVASMVAAYYGITLSMQQVRDERLERAAAVKRAEDAESAAQEADVWAAQMESGLRVAKVKLDAAGVRTDDVAKAAGVEPDFF